MRGRGSDTCWSLLLMVAIASLALIPFTFYLVVSLSPGIIHTLSLATVTGDVIDSSTNVSLPVKISVGPTGGCMWFNGTSGNPTKCIHHIPFKPDAQLLHLPSNETLVKSFPVAMGRAMALNHVMTVLTGLCIVAALLDVLLFKGGACLVLIYFTITMMWITFILETTYISLLHKRLESNDTGFDYHIGNGYWLILAATVLVSLLLCGNGSIEIGND